MISRLEALCDSIVAYTHYTDPTSVQYRLRNPLGLLAFCMHANPYKGCPECKEATPGMSKHAYDVDTGLRVFQNHVSGYHSALYDLKVKCSGKSRSKVKNTSTLKELIRSYYLPDGTANYAARFLRKALGDDTICEDTPIEYFVEKEVASA
jgi:hypothetical protein